MNFSAKTLALTAVLALSAVPAFALPAQVPSNPGTAHIPDNAGTQTAPTNPGRPANPGSQSSSNSSKAKAYGKLCADQSKKHVAGEHGTPFSKCVTAMAKVAGGSKNPTSACKTESKKHVAGQHGTPFSKCVSAAAKLLDDQAATTPVTPPAS
ncbi:MAG TPA: hypothetical protein VL120_07310 [Solirubrobacteraceae bacterium]|jgi:hypothetical protein|nr:hypothetical protein [Solirubrobacteraceae bacterium]